MEYRAVRQRKYVRIGRGRIDRHARHAVNNVLALQLLRCAEQSVVYTDPVAFNIAPIINGSLYKDAVHGVKQAVIRRRDPLLFEMQNILIRRDPLLFIGCEGRRTLSYQSLLPPYQTQIFSPFEIVWLCEPPAFSASTRIHAPSTLTLT